MKMERYQRQIVLPDFGIEGQERLLRSSVLVVGAGGLGVPVLQYLVGMGVGSIQIVDGDTIALSNLHRQVLYTTADVGKYKAPIAKERLSELNQDVSIQAVAQMLNERNARELISSSDLVIDCTDTIEARYLINDVCVNEGVPFVYGALYRSEGHISVFNYEGSPSYRDVYPDDSAVVDNCNEVGVIGVLPGIIGTYQAMEAIKILTGNGTPLVGKMLVIDAMHTAHHLFEFAPSYVKQSNTRGGQDEHLLTWGELMDINLNDFALIDIRSESEYMEKHDERFQNIPFVQLGDFRPKKNVILVCNKGNATRKAASLIASTHPNTMVWQMKGGYSSYE